MNKEKVSNELRFIKTGVGHNVLMPWHIKLEVLSLKAQVFENLNQIGHETVCMLIRFMRSKGCWAEFTHNEFYNFSLSQEKSLLVDINFNGLFNSEDPARSYLIKCPTKNDNDQALYALRTTFIWLCATV